MSLISFDATKVDPLTARTAWPKGKYRVSITTSEIKDVGSKGSGNKGIAFGAKALEMLGAPAGFQIPGSLLMWNVNFQNSNETAQRIGQQELSSICHATGILQITDTANLHGRDFVVDVDERFVQSKNENGTLKVDALGKPEGVVYNDIKGYYKADGSALTVTRTPVAQAAATPPAWAQNAAPAPTPPPPAAAPTPTPPPAAPAPVLYYINQNGVTAPSPVPLSQVLAMNPAEIAVNEYGKQEWVKGVDFFAQHQSAAPAAAPSSTPPWMRPQQ